MSPPVYTTRLSSTLRLRPEGSSPKSGGKQTSAPFWGLKAASRIPHPSVKALAVPRAGWAKAFEQFGIPKGHTGPAVEMFEAVNAGWMDLGAEDTEHVAVTTSARDVFEAAQNAGRRSPHPTPA